MTRPPPRAGVTLLELVVALAIIGITGAVAALAWRAPDSDLIGADDALARLASDARRIAVSSGRVQRVTFRLGADGAVLDAGDATVGSVVRHFLALPDGSVIGDSALRLDRFNGHTRATSEAAR